MKQDDRFFRLMHAVDDDLLEEAMQPVRRRRHVWIPLAAAACLCIAAALAAVPLLRAPARQDVQPDGTQKQSGTSATEAAVPSSITTDAKAIMDLGYTLAVPADSQDVVYSLVPTDSDIPMAQVCYVSNGIRYTARSLKTDSAADLTGSSANWTQELSWSDAGLAMDLRTDGEESWVGWYTGSTGTQWALGAEDSAQSVLHSACGILKTLGYDVAVAPEDAENVTYSVLEIDGQTVAETAFTLDGIPYRWHVGTGDSEDPERLVDLSGSERVYPHTVETTIRWCRAELSDDPGNAGCKLIWIDIAPGLAYSLETDGTVPPEALQELAESLFVPAQGEEGLGQPRTIASSAFAGYFSPICRFGKFGVHKVRLRFPNLISTKNLSSNALAELCGAPEYRGLAAVFAASPFFIRRSSQARLRTQSRPPARRAPGAPAPRSGRAARALRRGPAEAYHHRRCGRISRRRDAGADHGHRHRRHPYRCGRDRRAGRPPARPPSYRSRRGRAS